MPRFLGLAPSPFTGRAGVGSEKEPPLIPPHAGGDKILLRGIEDSARGVEDSAPATQIKIRNELFG